MARAIFLGLLALNLVLFGWHLSVDGRSQGARAPGNDVEVPRLSLVDENSLAVSRNRLSGEGSEKTEEGQDEEALPAAVRCLSLGPFSDDAEFSDAQLRLGAMGMEGTRRRAEGQIWVGYWIYLPPTGKREDAVGMVKALRERGLKDIYIEPAGERENAVSLGVFSERQRAQRRFREIRDLGFEPQIARRNRQGTVYWLDFVPEASARIDPADFQTTPGRIVRLASRVCQQPGVQIE